MLQIGFKCNRGVVRKNNEDACFVIPNQDVYIVADGVGGNNSGEIASSTAVESLASFVKANDLGLCGSPDEIFGFFTEALDIANRRVFEMGREDSACRGMASTVVMSYINGGSAYLANVGDSRLYIIGNEIRQITRDHSLVEEMVRMGGIDRNAARNHPDKNIITRAVGATDTVEIDFFHEELQPGDIVLMCSDGLTNMLEDEEIGRILREPVSIEERAQQLVEEANDHGGKDNIAVIIIDAFAKE